MFANGMHAARSDNVIIKTRDFFKPNDSETSYCEMLQSNDKHQWSSNGVDWVKVSFDTDNPGDWAVQRHRSLPTTTRGSFFPFGGTTTARVVQPAAAAVRLLQWTKRSQASLETGVRIALGKRLPCLTATTLLSFCLSLALITGGMAALDHISTLVARAGTCSWLQTISLANLEQKVAKCPGYPHIVMAK